jgi:prepilin-type N-terminal cleavage/methylation domain-containing protein
MMRYLITINRDKQNRISRRAFTLIEILVALAIFSLLLVIILVPLNMGFTMLHLGKAQADVQGTAQQVINRMRGDLTRAIYVYPNDILPSVTNSPSPYAGKAPYLRQELCSATSTDYVSNLSRIDMLLPQTTDDGNILTPIIPTYYIVTYYSRRWDVNKDYNAIDNPIVLYRAQIPFRGAPSPSDSAALINSSGNAVTPTGPPYSSGNAFNANIYNERYTNKTACGSNAAAINRSADWLVESADGEPNLVPLTNENDAANPADVFQLYGSHVAMLPVDTGMVTNYDYKQTVPNYVPPKSTFICSDVNSDGVIDQVKLSVSLQKVDDMGAQPRGQEITLSQVVDLPNVSSLSDIQ